MTKDPAVPLGNPDMTTFLLRFKTRLGWPAGRQGRIKGWNWICSANNEILYQVRQGCGDRQDHRAYAYAPGNIERNLSG